MKRCLFFILTVLILNSYIQQAHAYYHPDEGRWISRDPIGEESFFHAYTEDYHVLDRKVVAEQSLEPSYLFAKNAPLNNVDTLGLFTGGGPGKDPGHGDFPGSSEYEECGFDFNRQDAGWNWPVFPWSMPKHFKKLETIENEIDLMLVDCDARKFELLMHQGQDYFSHYKKGWRTYPTRISWPLPGHPIAGKDYPDDDWDAFVEAWKWTTGYLTQWYSLCCLKECEDCKWISRAQGPCKK